LDNANLRGADLSYAYLQGAHLEQTLLAKAYLSKANLNRADMKGADLRDAYLGLARLNGADLRTARLEGAMLIDTELQGAKLGFAQLQRAMLSNANLEHAEMFGADLRGADLEFAKNVTQAQIEEAFADCTTRFPANLARPRECEATAAASDTKPEDRCQTAAVSPPQTRDGVYTIVLKSDANTCALSVGPPGEPGKEVVRGLDKVPSEEVTFGPAVVGRFYTHTPIPADAPRGTQVVNIPPGDGRSGYFRLTFVPPSIGRSICRRAGRTIRLA
jgi:Pentapeptide repeats (8 copies)